MIQSGRDVKVFSGAMDQDTEARYLKDGNYRYLLNARSAISSQGSFGAVEDVMGNELVPNSALPPGQNKVIGSYEDIAGQSCIYFVWNSDGFHGIYRWYSNRVGFPNGVIETIYKVATPTVYTPSNPNPLNFQENSLITGVNLAEDILCWTDDTNQPKSIDVPRITLNKPTVLHIYLTPNLPDSNTAYVINYRSATTPAVGINTTGFTFTPGNLSLANRCEVLTNQINLTNGAFVTAVNRIDYIEVTPNFNGDFYILCEELNGFRTPQLLQIPALPHNAYPLFRTGIPGYNQPDLLQWHTNLIKTPPRCPLKVEYDSSFQTLQQLVYANIEPFTTTYNTVDQSWSIYVGSTDDTTFPFYDNDNAYTLGSTFAVNLLAQLSNAYITTPLADLLFGQVALRLTVDTTAPPTEKYKIQIIVYTNDPVAGPTPVAEYYSQEYSSLNNNQTIQIQWNFNFATTLNGRYYVRVRQIFNNVFFPFADNTITILPGSTIKYNSSAQSAKIDLYRPYLFRAKYVFVNNENSVYSSISVTPKPKTYKETSIKIDYSDLYISNYSYASLIKNIVLAYSDDDGVTWYDFKILNQNDFYVGDKTYYFFGNEFVATVPPSVAIAPYHAVPLKAKSQEYIDNRVWFGGILEGYDSLPIDVDFTPQYLDIQDATLYPDAYTYNNAMQTQNYGSFWERGYIGYIGIVYYDDYDRKTYVNLGANSKIITKFWSQGINGVAATNSACVIDWQINSLPPNWATKYQFVRTKNIRTQTFLEWTPSYKVVDQNYTPLPAPKTTKLVITESIGTTPYPSVNFFTVNGVNIITPGFTVSSNDIDICAQQISAAINAFGVYTSSVIDNVVYVATGSSIVNAVIDTSNGTPYLGTLLVDNFYGDFYELDFSSIADYNTQFGAKLEFTYVQDDYVLFKTLGYYEARITNVIGNLVYVDIDPNNILQYEGSVQVYTKAFLNDTFYYEFGECYEIVETQIAPGVYQKYHQGQTQNQTAVLPATGRFGFGVGNVWYRSSYTTDPPWNAPFDNVLVQRQTFSDYTRQTSSNNGRVNVVSDKGQIDRISTIRFSNVYVGTTQINGLNAFELLNESQYNIEYGLVTKMQVVNNDVLKLIFSNSYQLSIYVSQAVLRQSQGASNLVSLSDEVAGNSHIIQRTLGTINAESVIVNDEADMFGYDENEGVVWVASGNGLIQISDRGMKSTFVQYAKQRRALGVTSETPAVYDLYHDEYILTLGNMPGFTGVTIAYNKQKNGWTSYYSFVPEYYGRVRDYVVSFVDGNLWVHDRNTDSKNFYGVQYNRQLTYISNKDFPKVKDFKAISVNGLGQNSCPTIRILPFQGYLAGMLSSLSTRFFQTLEGVQYAYFQKDKLSPGFGGNQLQALANGRNLKGQVIEVTLENNDVAKSTIYSSDIVYFYSEHS